MHAYTEMGYKKHSVSVGASERQGPDVLSLTSHIDEISRRMFIKVELRERSFAAREMAK